MSQKMFLNVDDFGGFFQTLPNHMVLMKSRVEVAIDRFDEDSDKWVNGLSGIEVVNNPCVLLHQYFGYTIVY